MLITVKILKGRECTIQVMPEDTVIEVKAIVERELGIPPQEQRLVYKGRPLSDDQTLTDCNVTQNAKLFLVVKKTSENTERTAESKEPALWKELNTFLTKHYAAKDIPHIIDQFKKDLEKTVQSLSLDDIERIATVNLKNQQDAAATS
ncbi:unnamed protein product [Owenia fusiformis]|uniref:Ubiquitin-like domain-containing protein n=1 Tax=Owenia fusiformis TaxID=6347 RepID=A0A8S4NRP7_OWEFU|nr:unnamed protein product [Owenia fusiformis]